MPVHPFASVTVTEYDPFGRLDIFCVVAPFDHKKLNGSVPPLIVIVIAPVLSPLHNIVVNEFCKTIGDGCDKTAALCTNLQACESVIVTV